MRRLTRRHPLLQRECHSPPCEQLNGFDGRWVPIRVGGIHSQDGLDVGSIEFIHRRIVAARDQGVAVLLVSAELDEILSLSDRIGVMYKGHLLDTFAAKDATREKLGLLMAGVHQ